jgi:hypothetical protein
MPAPKYTQAEFIEIWNACDGVAKEVAKRLGVTIRQTMARRRSIEEVTKTRLKLRSLVIHPRIT